jgi:hypothetical protein
MSQAIRRNQSVSITEVKAAYLLAYYHFTYSPIGEAWEHCSKAVRMAYLCGLHQIDNPNRPENGLQPSQLDTEEMRCVWWAIYIMDSFCNLMSFTPSNIEDVSMATDLPAIVIAEATTDTFPFCKRRSLEDKMDQSWYMVEDAESLRACVQNTLVFANSLGREVSCLKRLCRQCPSQKLDSRVADVQVRWESLLTAMPDWFLSTQQYELEMTAEDHRQRLEVLTTVHV